MPWRALGTHRGDIGSVLPASDRFVTLHGLHYLELSDGLVRRARGFFDLYDAATQLGLLPGPRRAGRDRAADAARLRRAPPAQASGSRAYSTVTEPSIPGCTVHT